MEQHQGPVPKRNRISFLRRFRGKVSRLLKGSRGSCLPLQPITGLMRYLLYAHIAQKSTSHAKHPEIISNVLQLLGSGTGPASAIYK